jgi:Glycogen recognition site of AMP-activated protein kinase
MFSNGGFSAIIQVPPGTHRFHFLVDGEWRISNEFATAVDSEGNLLNYFEASQYSGDEDYVFSRSALVSCIVLLQAA